jgi:eukaryotic-like serine/threonine-protein kinase
MPLAPGTLVNNRYRIVSILGQGGMGAVYRASDEHLLIPVAVKENLFLTEEYGRQFQREAHILAGLRHVNLPHVTDYFAMENQGQYLVMDYIEGEDLRQRMERMGSLPEREAILIGISICDALTYLHNRQDPIVHRDIKPGNIKVTPDGLAVLVDFGLAKVMQSGQVTSTGARAMTPGYSPPEQYGTARTDPRSDIYSLGATLYAALTGIIPEDGLARMTSKAKLTPIRELAPRVNRKLADTIELALEVDPDRRYQDAEEFKERLIEAGELASYYQPPPPIPPPPAGVNDTGGLLEEPDENLGMSAGFARPALTNNSRRRRKRSKAWIILPGIAVLIAALYLLFLMSPDGINPVIASISNSPTRTAWVVETADEQNPEASGKTGQPEVTASPELTETAAPTETPMPEPTATLAPTETVTPVPSATATGGGMGQIAFASDRKGSMQIYLINADGKTAPRQITNLVPAGACQPAWSPDGMRLVFTSPCPGKQDSYPGSNLYILDLEDANAEPVQITSSLEGDYDPAWSPNGKRIAFTSLRNGSPAIFVVNLDDLSASPQKLTKNLGAEKHPAWSPSGTQLAYVRQAVYAQIWVMSDNGQVHRIFSPTGPVNNLWPAWSTDEEIIFYSQSNPEPSIPRLLYRRWEDRDTNIENPIPVTQRGSDNIPYAEVQPSPDGFWLAFESWPDGKNHDIYIMNLNGANQTRITTDPGFDFGPVWRPVK